MTLTFFGIVWLASSQFKGRVSNVYILIIGNNISSSQSRNQGPTDAEKSLIYKVETQKQYILPFTESPGKSIFLKKQNSVSLTQNRSKF